MDILLQLKAVSGVSGFEPNWGEKLPWLWADLEQLFGDPTDQALERIRVFDHILRNWQSIATTQNDPKQWEAYIVAYADAVVMERESSLPVGSAARWTQARQAFADGWDHFKDNVECIWTCGWPGNGSLEANLAGLPVLGVPSATTSIVRGVSSGSEIALGLSQTLTHAPGLLERFAVRVGAAGWWEWERLGLADLGGPFREAFLSAAQNASVIRFNLSGMNLAGAARIGAEGFEVPGLVTSAELMTIIRNPAFLSKTIFYRDGRVLTAAEVLSELGL